MNFRRGITPAVISALLLSGCSAPVTENSSPAPISAEETVETEQDTAETAQASSENTSEPEQQASETNDEASEKFPSGGSVGRLYNMDEEAYPQMVQLSENNIFVDYDYIKNIPSDTANEKYAYFTDIAVEAVKKSDRYKMVSRWINDSKYYAVGGSSFMGGISFYTYENGAFSEVDTFGADDSPNSLNIRISDCPTKNTILIEGYDKALAEMVTPAEAKKLLSAQ